MAQDTPSRKLDQYIVRFPDGMRDQLKRAAKENNRSLNAEIIARLELASSFEKERINLILERDHYKQREKSLFNEVNMIEVTAKKFASDLDEKDKEIRDLKDFEKKFKSYIDISNKQQSLLRRGFADSYLSYADFIDEILNKNGTDGKVDVSVLEKLSKRFRSSANWLLDDIKKTKNMFSNDKNN
ncbi:Arc family DNA-binding protein [Bartonella sp. M0193]|uniref:Arc family DNA-binding protein n=1 Tax=Bartonella TaxID=773 RepID=UPI0018DCAEEC|nr:MULTISPECIES: Arc family DNA-binding protein [Bartonella]MBI0008440.1 Arc family DNA-binding protein [Bartonella sp. M0193]MBI0026511.1 Arc family DNA-binding protein [Bartonella apihabitans]